MLIISFDFGTKNIGVAIGQKITGTASALESIKSKNGTPNWNCIKKILIKWQPIKAIIGLPINMNGTEQKISIEAKIFAKQLNSKFNINIEMHDERLSTFEAKNNLFTMGGFKYLKKNRIDALSAVFILESWLQEN